MINGGHNSRRAQFWIGVLISIICLGLVFWLVDLEALLKTLQRADWRVVLVIVAGQLAFTFLRAWRWLILLKVGAGRVGYWPVFHAQNIGYLVTNLFPFRLGDLARSYLIGQDPKVSGVSMSQALSTVVVERVLDMLVTVVLFAVAARSAPVLPAGLQGAAMFLGVTAAVGFLTMILAATNRSRALLVARWMLDRVKWLDSEKWGRRAESFLAGFGALTRWSLFLPVMALSVAIWLSLAVGYTLGLRGFWPDATWSAALFSMCAVTFGITAPSSPGFVGVFHGAVILGLSVFPVAREQALAFAIVYHATMYLSILVLGLISLSRSGQSLGSTVTAIRNLRRT